MPLIHRFVYIFFPLLLSLQLKAQEYNVWMYTGVSLDFNTEPPSYAVNKSAKEYFNATVSDEKGQLLYYTGGLYENHKYNILNWQNDTILPTASLWKRGGDDRYFSLFVRGNDSIYYHLYNATPSSLNGPGFFYTKINRNANNGKGGIVSFQRDIRVYPAHCAGLGATMNLDSSWWVVTRCYDSLLAFKIEKTGITGPFTSYAPDLLFRSEYKTTVINPDQFCVLRFSHDGRFIVCLNSYSDFYAKDGYFEQSTFTTYEFDKSTGFFYNNKLIEFDSSYFGNVRGYSDVEFSPNDSLIYVSSDQDNNDSASLSQYERYSVNLKKTQVILANTFKPETLLPAHTIILGQNGRIYLGGLGGENYGLIYHPNRKGFACMPIKEAFKMKCDIDVNGNGCPQADFPFSRYHGLKMDFAPLPQCDSSLKLANLCDKSKFVSYKWYIYATDSSSKYVDSTTGEIPHFKPPAQGRYWVKLRAYTPKGYGPWYSDTIVFEYLELPKAGFYAKTNTPCRYVNFELSDNSKEGTPNGNPKSWHWYFGDGTDSTIMGNAGTVFHAFKQTGSYPIKLVYNDGFCADSITLNNVVTIKEAPRPGITATPTKGCKPVTTNFSRTYTDSITAITYNFGDSSAVVSPTVNNGVDAPVSHMYSDSGRFIVKQTLTGPTGCVTKDSTEITVLQGFDVGQRPSIVYATVEDDKNVQIVWDSMPNANKYQLLKSENQINWKNIAGFTAFDAKNYLDITVKVSQTPYFYKLKTTDTCATVLESNLGSTILLKGKNYNNEYSIINWTPYQTWTTGVKEYQIETKTSIGNWQSIATLNNVTYKDNNFGTTEGLEECYRITALSNDNTTQSISNTLCLPYQPIILIPNTFTPDNNHLNDVFSISCLGIKELKISIYDRYGELIFQCNGTDCKWDGTFGSQPCPDGVYTYIINAQTVDKKNINTAGSILLLR